MTTTTAGTTAGTTTEGCGCPESRSAYRMSRRRLLGSAAATGVGLAGASVFGDAFRQVAYGAGSGSNVIVVLSLRGGADGLSMVVPRGTDHDWLTSKWRPVTAVPESSLLGNDPRFGLHPAFAPLMPMWQAGRFGAVHATGLPAPNRSHFDSMLKIEEANLGSGERIGWINRAIGLDTGAGAQDAVQLGDAMLPTSLAGPAQTLGVSALTDLNLLMLNDLPEATRRSSISKIWANDTSLMGASVRSALQTVETCAPVVSAEGRQTGSQVHASAYPDGPLKSVLANTAALIRADVGTSAVTVDYGNWDMHAGMVENQQDASRGWMFRQVNHLAASLAAFFADLGSAANRVTLVTISEFGRRVLENGDAGLDHGYANAMLMLGAGVKGGSVHGRWPGLAPQNLTDGDLSLGQDYRSVLWEVLSKRFPERSGQRATIFPGFTPETIGAMA